jgi:4-diphosphocytidyl-2-C-methyl-D-erythritol kinase
MLCFPNAKINIGLNVIERRPDNFHNLETVFYPVGLSDVLEVIKNEQEGAAKVEMSITGADIPGGIESNLCVKAYHLLDEVYGLPPVKIFLHKIIPMGAGLGGGSSDGAYTLVLLDRMFDLGIGAGRLAEFAAGLGSDCAFFIENKPAFGTGKGNVLEPVSLSLSGYYIVLVKPLVFVGTAEAYAGIVPCKPAIPLKTLLNAPVNEWQGNVVNDFEDSILKKHPGIQNIKDELYAQGALYASMTGSGSAVYGIFDTGVSMANRFAGCFYWTGKL